VAEQIGGSARGYQELIASLANPDRYRPFMRQAVYLCIAALGANTCFCRIPRATSSMM
jgi:hypothetical protein